MSISRTPYRPADDAEPSLPTIRALPRLALWAVSQILLLLVLFQAYKMVRKQFITRAESVAYQNAEDILAFQGKLNLNFERSWQSWVLDQGDLILVFNRFYAHYMYGFHAVCVILLLVAPVRFQYMRRIFIISMIIALPWFALYPLAPPRFMTDWGFVDTLAVYGPNYFREGGIVSANRFAAMPSMHCGWTLIGGMMIAAAFPWRWRWIGRSLGVIVSLLMAVTVMVTGNHYWLDIVGGWAVVVLSLVVNRLLPFPLPIRWPWQRTSGAQVART